jgi:hypothetical protein
MPFPTADRQVETVTKPKGASQNGRARLPAMPIGACQIDRLQPLRYGFPMIAPEAYVDMAEAVSLLVFIRFGRRNRHPQGAQV